MHRAHVELTFRAAKQAEASLLVTGSEKDGEPLVDGRGGLKVRGVLSITSE